MGIKLIIIVCCLLQLDEAVGKTWLKADGKTDTYKLINSVLGGTAVEPPDCAHKKFGPHITQQRDGELKRPVFAFHIHVRPDNDGCTHFNKQRNEIKTFTPSPAELKGFKGDTVSLSWNFKLDPKFQASSKFCHIHQIKGSEGGDDGSPLITITPRKRTSGQILEVIHMTSGGAGTRLGTEDLSKFMGTWIHAREELTYGSKGKYSLVLSRTDNGQVLMTVSKNNLDLWRKGAEYVRPKWGIYRSLDEASALRDETVLFDSFCLAKGKTDKCT